MGFMLRWLTDLSPSVRAASYFLPREEAMTRVARVMQTGRALYLACHERLTDWAALSEALGVSALAQLDEVTYLILDDTDVLASSTLMCLVRTLLQETQHIRLVLFGRRPLIDLYEDMIIAPVYQCFIGPHRIDSPYEVDQLILYVETFGAGRIFANGHRIENWNGPQQIETLLVLLDLLPATQETLLMALFGEISEEAYSKFHVSKTYINRALRQDITMRGWGDQREQAYYLSDRIVVYSDYKAYTKLTKQMFDHKTTAESFLLSAAALMRFAYRDYMGQTTPSAYLDQRRLQIRHTVSQVLAQAGRHLWQKSDLAHVEALLTRALRVDRTNEDAADLLILFYRQQGRPLEAADVYKRWHEAQQSAGV
jgi:hypothetical protein